MSVTEISAPTVEFVDYPIGKFGKKVDFWTSPDGLQLISGWRQNGMSIKEIYERVGVDVRTFRAWRGKHPELDDILTVGQEISNAKAVNSLFKKVTGFYYDEITRELVEGEMRVTKIVTKYVPPETKACLAWLFNRNSADWRAIQEPLDSDSPSLLAAQNVLVAIREATGGHGNAQSVSDGQKHPLDSECKENTTESLGENIDE
jgi:hypothetical protein